MRQSAKNDVYLIIGFWLAVVLAATALIFFHAP
jgi:hypothetical protein